MYTKAETNHLIRVVIARTMSLSSLMSLVTRTLDWLVVKKIVCTVECNPYENQLKLNACLVCAQVLLQSVQLQSMTTPWNRYDLFFVAYQRSSRSYLSNYFLKVDFLLHSFIVKSYTDVVHFCLPALPPSCFSSSIMHAREPECMSVIFHPIKERLQDPPFKE